MNEKMNYRYEGWLHIWGEFRLLEVEVKNEISLF